MDDTDSGTAPQYPRLPPLITNGTPVYQQQHQHRSLHYHPHAMAVPPPPPVAPHHHAAAVPPLSMVSVAGRMTVLCVDPFGSVYRLCDGHWVPARDLEVRRRVPALTATAPPDDEDEDEDCNIPVAEAEVVAAFALPGGCTVM